MNRLMMNMKEEVQHSNPLKGLSQKTSHSYKFMLKLINIRLNISSKDDSCRSDFILKNCFLNYYYAFNF